MSKKKVYERTLEDYREQAWGDSRCNWCQNQWGWNVKSSKYSEICPEFRYKRFAAYSGMGKFHIIRALLEGAPADCDRGRAEAGGGRR